MSKRKLEDSNSTSQPPKKQTKTHGFSVGPANLPDGTYRRKTQKIKDDLISKAKVKKSYAKLRSREDGDEEEPAYDPYAQPEDPTRPKHSSVEQDEEEAGGHENGNSNEIHPERQAMLDAPEEIEVPVKQKNGRERKPRGRKSKQHDGSNANMSALGQRGSQQQRDMTKPVRYQKEFAQAEERKVQEASRQLARQQRDRERKAMSKARRPGKDGKQRLGRQSDVLLSRVKRLVGKE